MRIANRRQFLWITGSLGGTLAARLALRGRTTLVGTSPQPTPPQATVTRQGWALGSELTITVLHPDESAGRAAIDAAFAELETVESLLSIYRPDSQLRRLNRDKLLEAPHPYLVDVLRAAEQMSRRSAGAFDVTIQPLWELFAAAAESGQRPDEADIARVRSHVDWRRIQISDAAIRLDGHKSAITLNGIAQGFATDRAVAVLQAEGVEQALLNTGEIGALGNRGDGRAWTIGIQHPRQADALVALAALDGRFLATSGDYATRFSNDHGDHHLFDPRTGHSAESLFSVTVLAPTGVLADALSTAAFVLGPERGMALIADTAGCDGLLITRDGCSLATKGFPHVQSEA